MIGQFTYTEPYLNKGDSSFHDASFASLMPHQQMSVPFVRFARSRTLICERLRLVFLKSLRSPQDEKQTMPS
jgi:hypothetical protein